MITIDGSEGEGGGQILRNACALSLVTGEPFVIEKIRGRRDQPGLMRQHLTAIEAACTIGGAECEGLELGSNRIAFTPGRVTPGEYRFAVGTAGSTAPSAVNSSSSDASSGTGGSFVMAGLLGHPAPRLTVEAHVQRFGMRSGLERIVERR